MLGKQDLIYLGSLALLSGVFHMGGSVLESNIEDSIKISEKVFSKVFEDLREKPYF